MQEVQDIRSVSTRMMYDQLLPEIEDEPEDPPRRCYSAKLHDVLVRWCEISPAKVVNRVYPSRSNSSKIYQSEIIRSNGFDIPDTLLSRNSTVPPSKAGTRVERLDTGRILRHRRRWRHVRPDPGKDELGGSVA